MTEDELKDTGSYGKGVYLLGNYFFGGVGDVSPRYGLIFEKGWEGIQAWIKEAVAGLDPFDPQHLQKMHFYQVQLTALEGIMLYTRRYAALARDMAKNRRGPRKKELLQMAENCEWVAEHPPRTFWEALQLWWLLTITITMESNGHFVHWGRFDQIMYPFFKKDVSDGTAAPEFIQELIEGAWIKISELTKIRDAGSTKAFGGVELGGLPLRWGAEPRRRGCHQRAFLYGC